jgi:hypothetical protein
MAGAAGAYASRADSGPATALIISRKREHQRAHRIAVSALATELRACKQPGRKGAVRKAIRHPTARRLPCHDCDHALAVDPVAARGVGAKQPRCAANAAVAGCPSRTRSVTAGRDDGPAEVQEHSAVNAHNSSTPHGVTANSWLLRCKFGSAGAADSVHSAAQPLARSRLALAPGASGWLDPAADPDREPSAEMRGCGDEQGAQSAGPGAPLCRAVGARIMWWR